MNRFTTRTGTAVVAAAAMLSLAACSGGDGEGGSGSQSAEQHPDLRARRRRRPDRLRPAAVLAGPVHLLQRALRLAVRHRSRTAPSSPAWPPSSPTTPRTPQTTLTLRDGVTFADGSTLDAELVKANLDRRSDAALEAYGALAPGGRPRDHRRHRAGRADRRHHLGAPQATPENNLVDTAGVIVGPDGVADPDSLETTPDGSGAYTLNEDDTTRASTYTLDKNDEAWNADEWTYDTIVFNVITDPQALANAVVSGQADVATILDPTTIELVESRQSTVTVGGTIVGFPVTDKTGRPTPRSAEEAPARDRLRHRPRDDRRRPAPGRPADLAAVPRGCHRLRPGDRRGVRLRPRPGHASCSPRPASPTASSSTSPCWASRTRTRSPSRASWPRSGSR